MNIEDKKVIISKVEKLIEPMLEDMGYELVDVEYQFKYGRWVLIIYIDKPDGVGINDCVRVNNEIGDIISLKDIITHAFVLEISSPGLNRPLKKEKDFIWAIGKKIKVKMERPINKRKNFTGYLKGYRDGLIQLEIEHDIIELPTGDIQKANLVYENNLFKTK